MWNTRIWKRTRHVTEAVSLIGLMVMIVVIGAGGCAAFFGADQEPTPQDTPVVADVAPDPDAMAPIPPVVPEQATPEPKAPADVIADTVKEAAPLLPPPFGTIAWMAGSALSAVAVGYRKVKRANRAADSAESDAHRETELRMREESIRATERKLAAVVARGMETIKADYPKAWKGYKDALGGAEGALAIVGKSEARLREFVASLQAAELGGSAPQ